jgi:type IV pilus assembly protein PilV
MKHANLRGKERRTQAGVGLIEVLIAVLVFAVGLLGMTTMQMGTKRASYEATQRSIATGLARDILERMRSNPAVLASYVVDDVGGSSRPTPGTNCNEDPCVPGDLAEQDLYEWVELLRGASEQISGTNAGGLVTPQACITHAAGLVSVAIAWQGVSELTNPTQSACGNGSYGTGDVLRRLMVITTYVGST